MRIISKNLKTQTVGECRCKYCKPPMIAPFVLLIGLAVAFVGNMWRKNRSAE